MDQKQRVKVTLVGSLINGATRTFLIDLPHDVNPHSLNTNVLDQIADDAKIAWEFSSEGVVCVDDHTVEIIEEGSNVNSKNQSI